MLDPENPGPEHLGAVWWRMTPVAVLVVGALLIAVAMYAPAVLAAFGLAAGLCGLVGMAYGIAALMRKGQP